MLAPTPAPTAIPAKPHFTLTAKVNRLFIFCQGGNLAVLYQELTPWMLAILALCLCWQILVSHYKKSRPSRILLAVFAIGGCLVLVITGKELGLLSAMLHLLCFSYVLKALEMNRRSDFYLVVLLGLFLLVAALIFEQNLQFALIILGLVVVNICLLLAYFTPNQPFKQTLKTSALLLLQSMPLAVVLFVVFPRLSPFWQVPMADSAATGLSDTLTPGDIASLALSDKLAFRANFERIRPEYSQLYWRALVLESYDGHSWQVAAEQKKRIQAILKGGSAFTPSLTGEALTGKHFVSNEGGKNEANANEASANEASANEIRANEIRKNVIHYQVIAEASFQHWLFALDMARLKASQRLAQENIFQLSDYSLRSRKSLTKTMSYHLDSYPKAPLELKITVPSLKRNLAYPLKSNPKLVQEAQALRARYPNDLHLVQAVLRQFSQQPFRYTLQPPLLEKNSLDQFYFDTRAGFCAHYASTFAFIMRAAGIPARLVTGYLGGEYNPQGNYFSVYQYDAHAWVEIWQQGIGWKKVDPTAAVSPERVENGLSAALLQEQFDLSGDFLSLQRLKQFAWLNALRLQLDAIDYQWTRLVLGYSAVQQYQLLSRWFGQVLPWKIALMITSAIMVSLSILWLLHRQKTAKDTSAPFLILYKQALILLTKKGLNKPHSSTAGAFAAEVAVRFPGGATSFNALSEHFDCLSYRHLSTEEYQLRLTQMRQQLKTFKQTLR